MLTRLLLIATISAGFALMLAAAPAGRASELLLANGDRITGTLVKRDGGNVYFHSDILGDIVVPGSSATVVDQPAGSAAAGSASAAVSTAGSAPAAKAPAKPAAPAVAATAKPQAGNWAGKLEFGYDNAEASGIRTLNVALRAQAERTRGDDNLLFKGEYLYGSSSGLATVDETSGDFRWRHNLTDRFFTQTDTSFGSNRLQQVAYQIEQGSGLGYTIFETPQQTVDVGGGMTGEDLDAAGVEKGLTYLGNAFQDYTYRISSRYTLHENSSVDYSPENRELSGVLPGAITPVAGDTQNYSYKFATVLEGKINAHLSLNLHFEYQYDNAVLDPASRAEQRVITTLGYGF